MSDQPGPEDKDNSWATKEREERGDSDVAVKKRH
jgi:hypothetical protein